MEGYLVNFMVYTLSMLGVLFLAVLVAKKSMFSNNANKDKNSFLGIESSINLEPRKNIYVIRAGEERFLISADAEDTRFMTKLNCNDSQFKSVSTSVLNESKIDYSNSKLSPMKKILNGVGNIRRR